MMNNDNENVCTLKITFDEADDRIDLEIDYGSDDIDINHESANQAQKIMNIVHQFAHQFLSNRIPNELVEMIMVLGTEVNADES